MNPPDGLTLSVKVADWPALMVPEVGEAESEKSFVVLEPVPVRLTDCGLPEALSVMLIGSGGHGTAAGIGLGKITTGRNAGEVQ